MPSIYSKGNLVYKYFPKHGWFWGEVTKIDCQNNKKYYYEVKYSDGDCEVITKHEMAVIYKQARDKIKANELMAQLPSFVEQFRDVPSVKAIALGPLCLRLIEIIQEIHGTNHIVINIKPEKLMVDDNFLMSPPSVKPETIISTDHTIISTDHLAKSIRFSDFGLITSFVGMKNDPTSQVQGTPLYASLNVHALQTPSRRDDVYAMLYVIGEIVLRIDDLVKSKSDNGTDTATQSYLPWSQATNDADIEKAKLEEMSSIKSTYFATMPTVQIAEQLFEAHRLMHATRFAVEPNYEKIMNLLRDIRIPVSTAPLSGHSNRTRNIEKVVVGAFVESYETMNHQKMAASITSTKHQAAIEKAEAGMLKGMTITHACTRDIENLPSDIPIPVSESFIDSYAPIQLTSTNHQTAVKNVEPEPLVENGNRHARTLDIENLPNDLEKEKMRLPLERLILNEQDITSNEAVYDEAPLALALSTVTEKIRRIKETLIQLKMKMESSQSISSVLAGITSTKHQAAIEKVEAEAGMLKGMTITHAYAREIENLPSDIPIPVSESFIDSYAPIHLTSTNHQAAVENVEPEPLVENGNRHARTHDIENLPSYLEIEIMRMQLERLTLNEQDMTLNEAVYDEAPLALALSTVTEKMKRTKEALIQLKKEMESSQSISSVLISICNVLDGSRLVQGRDLKSSTGTSVSGMRILTEK